MYVLHLGGIAFSRISARKKGSIFIPFLRLSQLQPILLLYSSIKRNESTITSFKLYNFSKKKKETKGMPEPMTDVFVSDLRSVERRRGKGGMAIRGARVPRIKSARSRRTAFRSEHRSRARLIAARVGDYARGTVG